MEINEHVTKLVKPSTPTPSTLCKYNISYFDEKQGDVNVPLILYYSTSHTEQCDIQTNFFNHLEISLSKTLTEFYPLAGRYTRLASFIDCRDQGALYVQAKAKFKLSVFLGLEQNSKLDMLQAFLPCGTRKAGGTDDPLLSVQVTSFECGGVAIGMCISHKFADMATICTFINNWATKNKTGNELELGKYSPVFSLANLFPITKNRLDDKNVPNSYEAIVVNVVLRVFSFKGTSITKLRGKLMSDQDNIIRHRPSKVQLTVALLWKALVDIDRRNGRSKASLVGQAVNLRDKVVPKVLDNVCGNFYTSANARIEFNDEGDNVPLQVLVKLLHDSTNKTGSNIYAKDYEALKKPYLELLESINSNDVNGYLFSSWCRFSCYTADFGWGKPAWRSTVNCELSNCVILMDDDEGDGVEAWVHLDEKRMCELKQDPNIQAYMVY